MKSIKTMAFILAMASYTVSYAADVQLPTSPPKFEPSVQYQLEPSVQQQLMGLTSNETVATALKKFKHGLEDLESKLQDKKLDIGQVRLFLEAVQARQNQLMILQNQRVINQNQKIIELLEAQKKSFKNAP
ncbi:hypothetical protein L3V82_10040 [Thiotrichales bacterium 19S3-7]|nr:hypothetical protein [Thiotrichales bacterium 19S3-7]MCF6802495.1 hypothetical protein [Thiotrichales bacterium 19S3-11]